MSNDQPRFFEVLQHMAETNNIALRLAPLSNLSGAVYGKHGTKVTIGFPGNVCNEIVSGDLVGGLLLVDRKEYEKARGELQGIRISSPAADVTNPTTELDAARKEGIIVPTKS